MVNTCEQYHAQVTQVFPPVFEMSRINPCALASGHPGLGGYADGRLEPRAPDSPGAVRLPHPERLHVALLLGFHSLVLKCLSKATGPKHTCQSLVGSDVLIITGPGNHHKRITLWCALILVDSI